MRTTVYWRCHDLSLTSAMSMNQTTLQALKDDKFINRILMFLLAIIWTRQFFGGCQTFSLGEGIPLSCWTPMYLLTTASIVAHGFIYRRWSWFLSSASILFILWSEIAPFITVLLLRFYEDSSPESYESQGLIAISPFVMRFLLIIIALYVFRPSRYSGVRNENGEKDIADSQE